MIHPQLICAPRGCVLCFCCIGDVCFDEITRNEDLQWFSGKRTFIDGGVYMRFNRGVGSRVVSSVFMSFCIFLWIPNVSSCSCIRDF